MPTMSEFLSNFSIADAMMTLATIAAIVIAREKNRIFKRRSYDSKKNP